MKRKLLLVMLCLVAWYSNAQHDNNWYFGFFAGLKFDGGIPTALTDSAMFTVEGSAVMSDENGELLFYTNGINVWNKSHLVMPNGTGLLGDTSTSQAAMIIPRPGLPGHYYLFTVDATGGAAGLNYYEIDMAADGGLGDVIGTNTALVTPVCEKITAAYHANGTDIWVTVHQWGGNAFYSYLVTTAGVDIFPVISNVGSVVTGVATSGAYSGYMCLSPDGTHLAIVNNHLSVELFDFDSSTGVVSDPIVLNATTDNYYGIEFSPDSNLLYLAGGAKLVQYQVNVPDVSASEIVLADFLDEALALRLAPNSKIYFISNVVTTTISVINNPNEIGPACELTLNNIDLTKPVMLGLPSFLTVPFYLLDIQYEGLCADAEVSFSIDATLDPDSVEWNFGDGETSILMNPVHVYETEGNYTVTLKAKKGNITRYFIKEIFVLESPTATQPPDMVACGNENGQAVFNLATQRPAILGPEQMIDFSIGFYLTLEDAEAGINFLPYEYTNITNPQTIYARVSPDTDSCHAYTSFLLTVVEKPLIIMPDAFAFCEGSTITLTAPAGFESYLWSTGAATRSIVISQAGAYTITVTDIIDNVTCEASKTITVSQSAQPEITHVEINDWTDNDNSITIVAGGSENLEYSIDGIHYQDSPVFYGLTPGRYTVYVKDKNGCGIDEEKVVLLMYPRFFTPNGDGENEIWSIKYAYFEPNMVVHVFDRYGKLVNSFNGNEPGWDGKHNGHNLPSTDYWFVAVRSSGREHKGHFSMIR